MDTALVVASISGAVALASAGFTGWAQLRMSRRDIEARATERRSEAKVALDRYRGPLLDAAWQFGDRIDNIRNRAFLNYLAENTGRADDVKSTTLFRMAYYLGWREVLRTQVQLLRFENAEDTRLVATFINDVTWVLASDRVDSTWPIWSDEQRAVGELMIGQPGPTSASVRGIAAFRTQYSESFSPWLERFAQTLLGNAAASSERLRLLQWALCGLVTQLDEEGAYGGGWINRTVGEIRQPMTDEPRSPREEQLRCHLNAIGCGERSSTPQTS